MVLEARVRVKHRGCFTQRFNGVVQGAQLSSDRDSDVLVFHSSHPDALDAADDSPRRTSTEALAATFGVTRSTLEEHLRKAERRVLEGFASVLLAQPVLARAAAQRPGRPARGPAVRST